MSAPKIKGYTIDEVAESRKQKLESDYDFIKGKYNEIRRHEEEIRVIRNECEKSIHKYRIESVNRVLEYIRFKKITDPHELDVLLCHCQNKLNGNIDGIELTLTNHKGMNDD